MKRKIFRLAQIAIAALISRSLSADVTYLGPSERPLAAHLATIRSGMEISERQPMNIVREGPSNIIFVFGAANSPGRYGSYFRTDLLLSGAGMGNGSIVFYVWVLPGGTDNRAAQGRRYSMPDNGYEVIPDIVGLFGLKGGATIVAQVDSTASTSTGAHGLLSAWGRTYTAGAEGGPYSTTLPATFG